MIVERLDFPNAAAVPRRDRLITSVLFHEGKKTNVRRIVVRSVAAETVARQHPVGVVVVVNRQTKLL